MVATLVRDLAFYLANHPSPLTPALAAVPGAPQPGRGDRKVTIGIVPDFTFAGKGVRLAGTVPGGPAENAGMQEGDVVILVGTAKVTVLQDLSDAIRQYRPGDKAPVHFLRGGREMKTTVEVRER
jgi:S1-C subfamily serine protease